jgi:hypothetical protein
MRSSPVSKKASGDPGGKLWDALIASGGRLPKKEALKIARDGWGNTNSIPSNIRHGWLKVDGDHYGFTEKAHKDVAKIYGEHRAEKAAARPHRP